MNKLFFLFKNKPEIKYSLWMFLAQMGVSASAFILTYVFANYVSDEVTGSYRYVLAVYSSISVFALIGLSTALSHSVAIGKSGSYYHALTVKLFYSRFASLLFFGVAVFAYFIQNDASLALALLVAGISFPMIETFGLHLPYLTGAAAFRLSALFLFGNRLLTMLFVVAVVFMQSNVSCLILAYCLGQIISLYLLHRVTLTKKPPNSEVDVEMINYAKHVTFMSVMGAITTQLDKFILFIFFGPVSLAKFWIASVLPQEMNRGVSMVVNTFFPRFAAGEKNKNLKDVKILFFVGSMAMCIAIILYALIAQTLFGWFLPLHMDAVHMSVLLMAAYGFVPYYVVWQLFSAQKKVKVMYILNTLEPFILIVCYLIFVPLYGVFGILYTIFVKNLVFNLHGLYYVLTNKT